MFETPKVPNFGGQQPTFSCYFFRTDNFEQIINICSAWLFVTRKVIGSDNILNYIRAEIVESSLINGHKDKDWGGK